MNLITRRRLSCPHRDRENRRRYVPRVSAYVRTDPGLDVAGLVAVTRIDNQDVHVLSCYPMASSPRSTGGPPEAMAGPPGGVALQPCLRIGYM
jgi:hypothetical protein